MQRSPLLLSHKDESGASLLSKNLQKKEKTERNLQNKEITRKIMQHTEIKASADTGQDPENRIKYLQQEQ